VDNTTVVVASGSVAASFNTSGLQPGRYNVAVDVSGLGSDKKEVVLVEKEVEESKELIPTPTPEAAKEANETEGEGEFLNETREEGEEVPKKIPVNMCDLLIAVIVAISISIAVKRRR